MTRETDNSRLSLQMRETDNSMLSLQKEKTFPTRVDNKYPPYLPLPFLT